MGIISLKIVDKNGEEVLLEDLNYQGIQMLNAEIEQLQKRIDEMV